MTYDLAVWEGDRPDEADAGQVFAALYDRYIAGGNSPPTPAITAFVRVLSLADAELKRRIHGNWSTRPVAEALDEPKAAERDEQRQLLREDAPDFQRCDHEVRLGVGREVPRSAGDLRGRIVDLGDIDADVATVRIHERQRLPGTPHAIGSGKDAHARVEHIEDEPRSGSPLVNVGRR